MDLNKIKLERLDPLGQVLETIELDGRWAITISNKIYFMTSDYIEEIKPNLEKIQKNFLDNLL